MSETNTGEMSGPGKQETQTFYKAWQEEEHVDHFGAWDRYSVSTLIRICSRFNDCQLFEELPDDAYQTLSDVGCANGRFYRYFSGIRPKLEYKGFDLSRVAIERAKALNPKGDFNEFNGDPSSDSRLPSDIVFCRDVVHHQTNPKEFLSSLYNAADKYLILRVRTRDVGPTEFDPTASCQYAYGQWVPYIVFNTQELIDLFRSFDPAPVSIKIRQHPVVLGGWAGRYLPKELYQPEIRTAESGVIIEKGPTLGSSEPSVVIETQPEIYIQSRRRRLLNLLGRGWLAEI